MGMTCKLSREQWLALRSFEFRSSKMKHGKPQGPYPADDTASSTTAKGAHDAAIGVRIDDRKDGDINTSDANEEPRKDREDRQSSFQRLPPPRSRSLSVVVGIVQEKHAGAVRY